MENQISELKHDLYERDAKLKDLEDNLAASKSKSSQKVDYHHLINYLEC